MVTALSPEPMPRVRGYVMLMIIIKKHITSYVIKEGIQQVTWL